MSETHFIDAEIHNPTFTRSGYCSDPLIFTIDEKTCKFKSLVSSSSKTIVIAMGNYNRNGRTIKKIDCDGSGYCGVLLQGY